jgi:Ca-activated chloride channel homolog
VTAFQEFTFAFPEVLWAFGGLPFLAALFWAAEKHRSAALNAFLSLRLQPRLAGDVSITRRRWSLICLIASLSLGLFALAQPRWGFTWEERTSKGRDVIIAIDTSRSMLAQDLKPSRMARARFAAQDLLSTLDGDRVGLIAFAGTAFLQAPLTADYDAVRNALGEIDAEIIPRGGTNLTAAIENAEDAFGKGESEHRALIIFTDGEELEADAVEAAKLAGKKFRIFTVGLGSPEGGLIPVPNERGGTDFVRDAQGQYVTSRLDEARLREIAEAAGGFYVHLQGGPAEMQQIVREGLGKMKERDSDSRFTKQPIERYQWPLAGAVLFAMASLLIGERRRGLRKTSPAAAAVLLFLLAPALHAAPEAEFNRGCDAFKAGDYAAAAHAFSVALGTGEANLQAKAAYNLANTLARRGTQLEKKEEKLAEWKNALQHYDRALAIEATHADARHNRDLVQKAIEELEKPQEEQQKQDDQKKKDEEQKKNDEKKEDSGKGEQEQKDQQQSSGSDEKKDQEKQGEKEQQQKGGGSDKKEQKDQEKKEEGASKEGQKEEPQKDGDKQQGAPKQGEKKEGEPKDQPQRDPSQNQPPKKGELKAGNPQPGEPKGEPQQGDAAEEAAALAEGRMTDKQAKALLESIKDARPRLLDPRDVERLRPPRGFKDW